MAGPYPEDLSTATIPAHEAVKHFCAATTIAAPVTKVWETIINTSGWTEWNRFSPNVRITEPLGTEGGRLRIGTQMMMDVNWVPTFSMPIWTTLRLRVTEFDPPDPVRGKTKGRIGWSVDRKESTWKFYMQPPAWLLHVEHVFELNEFKTSTGETATTVLSWEAERGCLAYFLAWALGGVIRFNLQLQVNDMRKFIQKD